jgi:alkylation response protein AidB-like acyl-CoA dehydrogenase
LPYIGHTAAVVSPVALGIARSAVEALCALVEVEDAATAGKPLKERARLHTHLAEAKAAAGGARALLVETIRDSWDTIIAGNSVTLGQRADLQLAQANAAASAFKAVELVMRAAGTSAIFPRNSLERHFRDITTLRQHAVFSENRFETAGRLYLGLMPEDYPAAIL